MATAPQVPPVGGRAPVQINFQGNHVIPQELFPGGRQASPLLKFYDQVYGSGSAQTFLDAPRNLQPLPDAPIADGYATHRGYHPGYTSVVGTELDTEFESFKQRNLADYQAVQAGTADEAIKARLRVDLESTLQERINDLEFRSSNFMDVPGVQNGVGNRLIYNGTDLAYLQETPTYKSASLDAQQAVDTNESGARTAMIKQHNASVLSRTLSPERLAEFKVLSELAGDGGIAHLDGTAEARNAIRAIISEADARDFNLANGNVLDFLNALETEFDSTVSVLSQQIEDVTQELQTATGTRRTQLLAEQAQLMSERASQYAQHVIGGMPANEVRTTLIKALANGKQLSEAAMAFLTRLGVRAIPGINLLLTTRDLIEAWSLLNQQVLERKGSWAQFADDFLSTVRGRDVDYFAVGPNAVTCWYGDFGTVGGLSHRDGLVCRYIPPHQNAPADNQELRGEPVPDFMANWQPATQEWHIDTLDETDIVPPEIVVPEPRLSVAEHQTIIADADGQVISRTKDVHGNLRDENGNLIAQISFAGLGGVIGSNFARLLRIDDPLVSIGVNTVLSEIGRSIGQAIEENKSVVETFKELPQDLGVAAAGAVSSYLFGELIAELGIDGELGGVITSTGGAAISQIAQNLVLMKLGTPNVQWNSNVVGSLANAAGAFLGTYLASQLVEFDTIEGQIGASIGAAFGAYVGGAIGGAQAGAKVGFSIWGPIGAAIGAFVGFIFGGIIGSLFAETAKSGADLRWNEESRRFGVGGVWAKGGASRSNASSIAQGAADVLNNVVRIAGSHVADGEEIRLGSYGTYKKSFVYRTTDASGRTITAYRDSNITRVLNYGIAISIADMIPRLAGGNVFVKRALLGNYGLAGIDLNAMPVSEVRGWLPSFDAIALANKFDMTALMGDLSTAVDYTSFLQQGAAIRAVMASEPDSAFTAMWTLTLARAWELGLHKRAATDWTGGWGIFLDEALGAGAADGVAFSPVGVGFGFNDQTRERLTGFVDAEGNIAGVLGDTIDTGGKDLIAGTDAADLVSVSGDRIDDTSGLTINGERASGAAHVIDIAATIEGGGGNDTIIAGNLGNDLLGGEGNDTLVGGVLDDWLLGGEGNDRLFAGAANYQFGDGDAAGVAAALNTSSNGDMLDGGEGDDVLYGSRGSDWLIGGEGNDVLRGGAGGDILDGGAGDDRGTNGEAHLLGGSGTDQYVFGYGSGIDVIFDESDNSAAPGSGVDSLYTRMQQINSGAMARNWAGGGDYEIDGSVKGGEDAIAFGPDISFGDLRLRRSGTESLPGNDLIITLTYTDPELGTVETGDQLVIKDWFESTRRVEWLRFADGQGIRIGDLTSFIVGNSASDVILGTAGSDFIVGTDADNTIRGLAGHDFAFGGRGRDLVAGDQDNDFIGGGSDDDQMIGGSGNDTAFGDDGNDTVYGSQGSDIVVGGRGNDTVIGGDGMDIFRYQRGDGSDVVFDDYVDNWETVWLNGTYTNGYVLDPTTATVTKNGVTYFDGSQWLGLFDYANESLLFRRHLGPVGGALARNAGFDYLEFGVGIDIQDLMLHREGNDLQIAITMGDGDGRAFEQVSDRITIRDWYVTGNSIENFVFAATGRHDVTSWSILGGGTEGADSLTGTAGVDWITGNGGEDSIDGAAGTDILAGNGGADLVRGGADDDVIFGGDDDDVLDGGAGADLLIGGAGTDIVSYASIASPGIRAFLGAPGTNTKDAIVLTGTPASDVYVGIEGIEGTSGADVLGGDESGNILRGLAGTDTLCGGAGDDIYEIDAAAGTDTIVDAPFTTEEIVSINGVFNSALYTATWTALGVVSLGSTWRDCYRLVVTRNGTGEEVYRSRDTIDFIYPVLLSHPAGGQRPLPAAGSWPLQGWSNGAARTGNVFNGNAQVAREIFTGADGGNDTLDIGMNVGLSDLSFQRSGSNLTITYGSGQSVTINGQSDANRAIENLQLRDGLVADLTRLVLVGETASAAGDLVAGDANANTLDGLDGDDVLSGAAGNDTLRGGEGDDVLEGGAGSDTLDGGNDAITAGQAVDGDNQTSAYGDTIRYVRSVGSVTIDLQARTAGGGHAAGDTIVAGADGYASVENVVGSDTSGDTLRGDLRANRLIGLGANDTLEGRGGDDVLVGGQGNDTLRGGDGDDNLTGDDGDDTLEGGNNADLLAGGAGNDTLTGEAGTDLVSGGAGNDIVRGGSEDDQLGGDAGVDQLYGDAGNDKLAGGTDDDTLYGGDGDDTLLGETGNDQLHGEAGNDTYGFDLTSGADTIVDALGTNRIQIMDAGIDQIWITRSGNDLRIGVIGGTATITVSGYYTAGGSHMREIAVGSHSLFLAHAEPLIAEMTAASTSPPASLPESVLALFDDYWHPGGKAAPRVADQSLSTDDLTQLSGSVAAIDHDDNIVSYALEGEPRFGSLALNTATGQWTYTPNGVDSGEERFSIRVTDADGNSSLQLVTVNVIETERALAPIIQVAQVALPEAPLTKVTLDSGSWIVQIEGALADTDRSEALDVRVSGVPDGITFDAGVNLGGGVWSFGSGPWPTRMYGPANWSQDLTLTITASSREIANGRVAFADPVTLNIEVNARPTNITAGALSFNENATAGVALTTLSTVDGDAGDTASYTLVNNAGGRFTLDANGTLRAGSVGLNYESATSHTIRVRVTDSGGLTYERDFTVGVVNVNEAPVVANQNRSTNEDTALTGSVGATDPDNNITGYAVATAATRGGVSLNATTGAWTYTPTANLYGADSFQVRVTDGNGLTAVQTVTVNVASVNDAPSNITLSGAPAGIAENDRPISGTVAAPVVLGTLSATDVDAPDAGDFATHVFSVTDSRFEVVSGNTLRLRAGAVLDFEAGTTVSVDVTVRDRNGVAAGLTFTRTFSFTVLDRDDYFYGTSGNDTITGTAGRNLIYGQGGSDTLTGAGANDTLEGGDGNDTLSGLGGLDTLVGGLGDDTLDGGTGVDTLSGGDGIDTLRGGDGNDTLNGEVGADLLYGQLGDDQLDGGDGNDRLEGGDANDRLVGGLGDDLLIGGLGADRFLGGAGVDTVSYESAAAGVVVNVTTTTGSTGEAAGDIFEDAPERLIGSAFADTITGGAGNDYLEGGAGADTIYGGAGNDTLIGGDGNDTLDAQSGNDTLNGGVGNDILIGGDDSDTYLMDLSSGADEIRNFDPNGTDIDVVGYSGGITNRQLWFERVGNDLVVTVVGTSARTTIKDWYTVTTASERANYKIDFFLAGDRVSQTINAEALVTLMAGYTRPTTQAQYDALHANPTFENQWNLGWNLNAPPTVQTLSNQTINEDGTLTVNITITDDFTPANGITVAVSAVRTDDYNVADLSVVNAPTIGAADANGLRTITITTRPNAAGQVAIKVLATDAGGMVTERVFLLTVAAVADLPQLTVVQAVAPTLPLTQPTLDGGFWNLNLQAALTDQDGSETLEIRIANVPSGITFNAGTNLGSGVWSFTPAQLAGLRVQGPSTSSQDLALTVTATAREANGSTVTTAPVNLNIVINARPTDLAASVALSFQENRPSGTSLATFTRTDADSGDTATYSLVSNAGGRFSIDAATGVLRATGTALNFESATSHVITVRVTDSGGLTYDENFTVTVTNVNEAPSDIAPPASLTVAENIAANAVIGTFTRTDPDAGDTFTFSLVDNAGGRFTIDAGGTLRRGSTALDFETAASHQITVRVTDANNLTRDEQFTVTVTNVNEAPTDIALTASQVNEDAAVGTVVGTLSRTDPESSDTATYTLVNNPGNLFQIVGTQLRTAGTFNYEAATSHVIRVRVTDGSTNTYEENLTITVVDRNEAPTDLFPEASLTIAENRADNAIIGRILRTDPDNPATQTATFSLVSDAGGRFKIDADGTLRAGTTPINYETGVDFVAASSWTIRVRVIDQGGLAYEEDITITVTDLNDNVPVITGVVPFSVAENSGATVLATLGAVDHDVTAAFRNFRYEVIGAEAGAFTINQTTGALSAVAGLNYESHTAPYAAQVRVWDGGAIGVGNSSVANISLQVNPVNEAPSLGAGTAFSIGELAPGANQTLIGTVAASDPDTFTPAHRDLRYRVVADSNNGFGGANPMFVLNPVTGEIRLSGTLDYENPALPRTYTFHLEVWDGGAIGSGLSATTTIPYTINVTEQNEGPRLTSVSYDTFLAFAGADIGYIICYVYGLYATDLEGDAVSSMEILDSTGTWAQAIVYSGNHPNTATAEQFYWMGDGFWSPWGTFMVRMRDSRGAYSTQWIQVDYMGGPSRILPPIVLDLDGDGIELTSWQTSPVGFDMDADGNPEATGWVGADDALLALDRDGDGAITDGSEISFIEDLPGALSDLEGLAAFDTDADGYFDAGDARYGEFRVWQDANHDGVSQTEELRTLGEHGITAINLTRDLTGHTAEGAADNVITATSEFVRADGTTGVVGDVLLGYQEAPQITILDRPPDQAPTDLTRLDLGDVVGEIDSASVATEQADVDTLDRSAHDERGPAPLEANEHLTAGFRPDQARAGEQQAEEAGAPRPSEAEKQQPRPAPRDWRDWLQPDESQTQTGAADGWQAAQPVVAASALHNSLSSVTRRRLQMIEAMAGFTDDDNGAANLSLRPHRSIDARTLELLTSVSQPRASL
jgi:Ca2+-binding RTX toxin-like protein